MLNMLDAALNILMNKDVANSSFVAQFFKGKV